MIVIGIDPGPTESAYVRFNCDTQRVEHSETSINEDILTLVRDGAMARMYDAHLAIERVMSYGRPVGETVFETVFWTGRFIEAWKSECSRISFRDVGRHLCNAGSGVKESHVRQALLDRFGPDPKVAKGNKSSPGALYGVANHQWSALAVAVTVGDQHENI